MKSTHECIEKSYERKRWKPPSVHQKVPLHLPSTCDVQDQYAFVVKYSPMYSKWLLRFNLMTFCTFSDMMAKCFILHQSAVITICTFLIMIMVIPLYFTDPMERLEICKINNKLILPFFPLRTHPEQQPPSQRLNNNPHGCLPQYTLQHLSPHITPYYLPIHIPFCQLLS